MKSILILSALCFALAGCGLEDIPSTGYLPPDTFGSTVVGQDTQLAAVQDAAMAFAHPANMQGKPAQMALAVASLDAMAGQFATGGRWIGMDSLVKQDMLDARRKVRRVLGVPEKAPSQSVIDHLVATSHALDRGDRQAALTALSGPDFTKPPEQTLAILAHFPKVQAANTATMEANQDFFQPDDNATW